ncbi:MAG TPA: AAA family ATPase, partial [Gemmatimonadales bacterium]|nr:AAA family ATPase [Gemmatimonadales bacterium]
MRTPEAMPPRYFLRCLGAPELRGPGGEPIRFRTRKHMALLAFLAVEPRQPHRRERLADLLWPDASPAEGRHSLATALSVIRGKLGPRTFESTRETVRFVAADLEVDLDRLARGDILGGDLTPPLEVGGFLDEFEVTRAPEFALWRDLRRAHWFPAIRRAFIVLMDDCRRTGDFARIEPLADRLLTLDELSEDAIRAKMEGRAFAGDRMSALRIFQQWRQKLDEELGATPSPLVEGMALRLRQRGFEPPGTAHIPTVPTDQWRDRVFVGRGPQYRVAYERWEETREGNGRHVLLLGDSGLGKTTLAERLVTAAGLEGAVSSRVQCYEVEREIPYAAIGTLVRGMLERPGANGTAPEWLAELARAVPVVAQKYPNLPPPRDIEGEAARLRLTEAVHQLATAIAEEHPLILVVDDVHLSDDASVAVLHLLMRRTQEQRVMIMLTAREPELAKSPNASRLKEVLPALALRPVELPPLTDEDMTQVLSALAAGYNRTMSPAVRRALLRASAGIPMVAELLFDDWRAHGGQCLALGIGAMTVDAQFQSTQDLFLQAVERVVNKLSGVARSVLSLAAILGDRLNDLSMYQLVDLTLAQTLAGMTELTAMRVLRDGGRDLEFRNELLRGYAYLSVPSPHRRALHGMIADRLIAAEANGEAVPGLTLAWHCYRAGRVDTAEPYLLRGSREAMDSGAPFETELALRSALPGLSQVCVPRARLLLVEALQEQSQWRESIEEIGNLHEWPAEHRTARNALELRARASVSYGAAGSYDLLNRAIALMGEEAEASARAPAMQAASYLAVYTGNKERSHEALSIATTIPSDQDDLVTRVAAISSLAGMAWTARRMHLLPSLRNDVRALSAACRARGIQGEALFQIENTRGGVETTLGDYAEALGAFEAAHRAALRIGDPERQSYVSTNIALCHGRMGNYLEQRAFAQAALDTAPPHPSAHRRGRAWLQLAW